MGFYAGYALSVYGRTQDRLSHVLVDRRLESNPAFFYPAPRGQRTGSGELVSDYPVEPINLADVPFVRLRYGLGPELLEWSVSFPEAVWGAQAAVPPVGLALDPSRCRVMAGGETLALRPSQFAFLWMLAERARSNRPGLHWSEPGASREFLAYYGRVVSRFSGRYEAAENKFGAGLTKENFDPQKSHINRGLVEQLGRRRAKPYLIVALRRLPGTRYSRFGLALGPSAIKVVESTTGAF